MRDFPLTEADRAFRAELRRFLARELAPRAPAFENDDDWDAVKQVVSALGDAGYLTALYRCPGVKEATVLGPPDATWGSIVAAFIVKGSPDLTAEAVDDCCGGQLAGFKRPRRIAFVDALPTSPSGKVIERELAALVGREATR